jgi:cystathionine gamma-lyase
MDPPITQFLGYSFHMEGSMRDGTLVTRAGLPEAVPGASFLPGPTFAGTYHTPGDPAESPYTYGRFHNPTWTNYEAALSELEGGAALAFSSGMAAITAIFGVTLRPGDLVVLPSDSYYTVRVLAEGYLSQMGIRVKTAPTAGNAQKGLIPGAKLLWLETPSTPALDVCDIATLTDLAHQAGVLVAVDNTTPTVLAQKPLALGADFSIASDTKALTGHSDLILGHVAVRDPAWVEQLHTWRTQTGAVPGPMEVWLAHRSLGTLDVRLSRQSENALTIASFLASRLEVLSVHYPGLPADPGHAIALRQMRYFGPVVSFVLASKEHAESFLSACKLVFQATSYGSLHTSAERRKRWGGDDVSEGFIRMNVGCEDIDDLLEDLGQALDSSQGD